MCVLVLIGPRSRLVWDRSWVCLTLSPGVGCMVSAGLACYTLCPGCSRLTWLLAREGQVFTSLSCAMQSSCPLHPLVRRKWGRSAGKQHRDVKLPVRATFRSLVPSLFMSIPHPYPSWLCLLPLQAQWTQLPWHSVRAGDMETPVFCPRPCYVADHIGI